METLTPGSILGHAVRRREDVRLVTGGGRYVDDSRPQGTLHLAFVRSPVAHARIRGIDTGRAATAPGVVAVLVAADLDLPARVGFPMVPPAFARPRLAEGSVRFVGEPLTVVVAESREAATDAAQLVALDLEPLPVLVDPAAAHHRPSVLLFPDHGSNLAGHFASGTDEDPLAGAELTVKARFVNQRLAPVPMEPEAIVVVPEDGRLTVWATSQTPFDLRAEIAASLGIDEGEVRVVVPDMGGGFGAKAGARPELVVVAAVAKRLGRPVQWVETRSENLVSMTHGRGQVQEVELGATRDGRLVGMRAHVLADIGAYPGIAMLLPFLA
ncbi:MAG TPA: molybdopterin cofactor-binding domain-containing protein, partial [Candidatus Acidoferrales bacterium]|nr:molybdopterin cofactor-binding domain-containing protein [Candidatus Acidoferrales bacterium]